MSDRAFVVCEQVDVVAAGAQNGLLSGQTTAVALYAETRYTPIQPSGMRHEQTKITQEDTWWF